MQAADPNAPNPVLSAYQNFTNSTPLVTRYLLHVLVVVWVLSFFLPLDMALANIPYFTIFYFEVYRILFSPFVGNNIISLIFAILIFYRMGKQMEWQHGSTGFMVVIGTIALGANLVFVTACFLMYMFGMTFAMYMAASGFWMVVLGLMAVDCMAAPEQPRRLLFIPVNIPNKYMPLALFALFSLLGGFQLAYAIALGIGYLYSLGYLNKIKPGTDRLEQWETKYLGFISSKPGFITTHGATGDGSMLPLNMPDGQQHQQHQQQGLGFGSVFNAGNGPTAQRPGASTSTTGGAAAGGRKDVFQGSARKLGESSASQDHAAGFSVGRVFMAGDSASDTVTRPSHAELQQRRLAALGVVEPSNGRSSSPSAPAVTVNDNDVRQITEMGYSEHDARRALQLAGGNLQQALNILTT